jgi:hypothetical protein
MYLLEHDRQFGSITNLGRHGEYYVRPVGSGKDSSNKRQQPTALRAAAETQGVRPAERHAELDRGGSSHVSRIRPRHEKSSEQA